MTTPEEEAVTSGFVRSYVITGGRALPSSRQLALHTLVTVVAGKTLPLGSGPEVQAIWELCAGGYLSVAEVAGHLRLPVGVVRLLLTDLHDNGHLVLREPPPRAQNDRETLEKVLHGLQSSFL